MAACENLYRCLGHVLSNMTLKFVLSTREGSVDFDDFLRKELLTGLCYMRRCLVIVSAPWN